MDKTLIDQIAAGEVVERPSSVVKELVENALDSGAREVAIDLSDGGLRAIVVTDDGRGMTEADLRVAFVRHTTSKLQRLADLQQLATFGFRGEALSSIASVSRICVVSRASGAVLGTRMRFAAGMLHSVEPTGAPVGTSMCVEDLFYNVPARQKFLRSAATEQAHVHEAVLRCALGRRKGGFVLSAGERTLLDVPADAPAHLRPQLAFGRRQRPLHPFGNASATPIAVSGHMGLPTGQRREAVSVWVFVNGRPVRDRMLQRAALGGYQSVFAEGIACLLVHVDVLPEALDVNVHPQKWEVRFEQASEVYQTVLHTVALAAHELAAQHGRTIAPAALAGTRKQAPVAPYRRPAELAPAANHDATPLATPCHPAPTRLSLAGAPAPWVRLAPRNEAVRPWPNEASAEPLWGRLRPLAACPPGHLCCQGPDDALWVLRLLEARVQLLARHLALAWPASPSAPAGPSPHAASQPLGIAGVWQADGLTQATGLFEALEEARACGLQLERVGPQRALVLAVPPPLADAEPGAVAAAYAQARAHAESPAALARRWCEGIERLGGWPGVEASLDRWAPALLTALHKADIHAAAVAVRLAADAPALCPASNKAAPPWRAVAAKGPAP